MGATREEGTELANSHQTNSIREYGISNSVVLPETINFARLTPERPKGQIHGNVSSWKTQQRGFLGNPGSPAKCGQRKQLCPPKNPGCGAQLVPLVFQIKWYLKKIPHKPGKAQSDSPCSQWLLAPSCPVRDSLTNSSEQTQTLLCLPSSYTPQPLPTTSFTPTG